VRKEKSLSEAVVELDWLAKISGLNINFSKTQVIWFGNKKYSEEVSCPGRNLTWGMTSFKLLGVNFDIYLTKLEKINFEEFFLQTKQLIKQWSRRNLTVIGRITVVKTLILPLFNHLFLSLPNPSNEIVKKINELLYSFIWNSPVCRVKKEILQNNYDNGGLKMINLNAFILSLKSTWICRLFQKDNKWQNIFMSFILISSIIVDQTIYKKYSQNSKILFGKMFCYYGKR
jgi:hypothetical protein